MAQALKFFISDGLLMNYVQFNLFFTDAP